MELRWTSLEERRRLVEYLPLSTLNGVLLLTWMVDGRRRRWLREDLRRELSAECIHRIGPELYGRTTAGRFDALARRHPWRTDGPEIGFRQATWSNLFSGDAAIVGGAVTVAKVPAAASGLKLFTTLVLIHYVETFNGLSGYF